MRPSSRPRSERVSAMEEVLRALLGGLTSGAGFGAWVGSVAVRANPSLHGPRQATAFVLLCVGAYAIALGLIGVFAATVARPLGRTRSRADDGFLPDFVAPLAGALAFALVQPLFAALAEGDPLRIGIGLVACLVVAATLRALLARHGLIASVCWGALGVVAVVTPVFVWRTLSAYGSLSFGGDAARVPRAIVKASTDPRVMVIAIDGADWERLSPLMDAGRLPNFARACERAFVAPLETVGSDASLIAWTSLATGVGTGEHGVIDATELALPSLERGVQRALAHGDSRPLLPRNIGLAPAIDALARFGVAPELPLSARQRRVPAFWNILSTYGVRCGVVRWPASWPAEDVDGYAVADDDPVLQLCAGARLGVGANARAAATTWPPDFTKEVLQFVEADGPFAIPNPAARERLLVHPILAELDDAALSALRNDERSLELFELLVRCDAFAARTAVHLWNDKRPPLLVVRLAAIAGIEGLLAGNAPCAERACEMVDGLLGDLLTAGGAQTTFVIVSERGSLALAAPEVADPPGVLIVSGPGVVAEPGMELAPSVLDLAPTVLALFGLPPLRDWPGRPLNELFAPNSLAGELREPVASYGSYEPEWPAWRAISELASQREALALLRELGALAR